MQNIEIKTRLADPADAERKLRALGAEFVWTRRQRDTFYVVGTGYLKLREVEGAPGELIAYRRAPGSAPRPSDYEIAPVDDPASLGRTLARSLGVRGAVTKVRRLFRWRHTRIHLDEVVGLGKFIELEAVTEDRGDEESQSRVEYLMDALALMPADLVAGSYSDLAASA